MSRDRTSSGARSALGSPSPPHPRRSTNAATDRASVAGHPAVVVADVFGVLVGLDTASWRAKLARIGEVTEHEFMERWRTSGLGEAWDTGSLTLEDFAANLSDLLKAPGLTSESVSALWADAVGTVDPVVGPIAARLSREGRLILASNHNSVHWPIVRELLAGAGISPDTPAVLSHQVGASKPDPIFYSVLVECAAGREMVFIDDRSANVEAAAACGINTFHHTDPARTAALLTDLLDPLEPHPGESMTDSADVEAAPHRGDYKVVYLGWATMRELIGQIAEHAARDGTPQTLVGVLRGGAVPAVWLSHRLGVRDVRMVEVVHTVDDGAHAAKRAEPAARNPASLGELTGRDVLVVDDVAGTGETLAAAARLVAEAGAARVRTAVCVVNADNWTTDLPAQEVVTHIGTTVHGWVVFPWEDDDEH